MAASSAASASNHVGVHCPDGLAVVVAVAWAALVVAAAGAFSMARVASADIVLANAGPLPSANLLLALQLPELRTQSSLVLAIALERAVSRHPNLQRPDPQLHGHLHHLPESMATGLRKLSPLRPLLELSPGRPVYSG